MPKTKNSFKKNVAVNETIVNEHGKIIGTIRIKPSGILWREGGTSGYHNAPLDDFIAWIKKYRKTTV
ncbi:MAG: hypothetical protein AABY45_06420 [Deltaproteobacteria bacterium]